MHHLTCWCRAGAASPGNGRSDNLNGGKDYIKQNGAKANKQTQDEGHEEQGEEVGVLEENGHALRYFATERAVSAESANPERGGATGEPEQSLESKIPTERYVNGVYEIPLSLNVCVIPSFNTTLRYSNEQVEY